MNGSNIFIGPRLTAVRFDGSSEEARGESTISGVFSNQGKVVSSSCPYAANHEIGSLHNLPPCISPVDASTRRQSKVVEKVKKMDEKKLGEVKHDGKNDR
ncbi:hypothetical protein CMV_017252 [Castanea mollissima]|uniref:Uncharacterized protein n=1 Tax=Castanea mollissima TaxID=60419 RepID=A0A8J4QSM1_9ROSI|nr:hypothetical protein CMV_017252 [Castanea mollissima]